MDPIPLARAGGLEILRKSPSDSSLGGPNDRIRSPDWDARARVRGMGQGLHSGHKINPESSFAPGGALGWGHGASSESIVETVGYDRLSLMGRILPHPARGYYCDNRRCGINPALQLAPTNGITVLACSAPEWLPRLEHQASCLCDTDRNHRGMAGNRRPRSR